MQQMDNALLHAALAESQAARYAAALHGKMQKALTVGVALGRGRPRTAASSQAASMSRSKVQNASQTSGLNQCRQATA